MRNDKNTQEMSTSGDCATLHPRLFVFAFVIYHFSFVICQAETWDERFLAYQKFLQETLPPGRPLASDSEAEKEEKREEHHRLAARYAEFSDKFSAFARQDGLFPPTAPPGIKREREKKIPGMWNLYKNIPINALDLWEEACYQKFRSLLHASIADPQQLATLNEFAVELEQHKPLTALFQTVKRTWYGESLRQIDDAEAFEMVVADYVEFLHKYPTEENLGVVGAILAAFEKIRSQTAEKQLQEAFAKILRESNDPDLRNLAEVFEGAIRLLSLLGNDLPLWGVDVNGKTLDPKTLEGKVVLLDFWATWCGPCIAEFPHLKQLYEKYREKGFEIVGYCVDSDLETMYAYLKQNPLPWILLSKEASRKLDKPFLSSHYGARRLPLVLLRDRSGKAVLLDARGRKLDEMLETMFSNPTP